MASSSGGKLQRLRAFDIEQQAANHECRLSQSLLELWGWGLLSTPHLQELAAGARDDGALHDIIQRLSAIGSFGKFPGNMRRDLMRNVISDLMPLEPAMVAVPYIAKQSLMEVRFVEVPVILPSAVFGMLYERYPPCLPGTHWPGARLVLGTSCSRRPTYA